MGGPPARDGGGVAMGAHTREFLKLTERLLLMKEDAKQLLARTNDKLERRLLTQLQAPLDHALCLVDYDHNAELDAADQAAREHRDAVEWAKTIREFPPEFGNTPSYLSQSCSVCGTAGRIGQTSGLCRECWRKAGCP